MTAIHDAGLFIRRYAGALLSSVASTKDEFEEMSSVISGRDFASLRSPCDYSDSGQSFRTPARQARLKSMPSPICRLHCLRNVTFPWWCCSVSSRTLTPTWARNSSRHWKAKSAQPRGRQTFVLLHFHGVQGQCDGKHLSAQALFLASCRKVHIVRNL